MKSTKMYINEKLNQYVTAKGIKQIYISQATGISADIISKILQGKRKIMADEFLEICSALNINPDYFRKQPNEAERNEEKCEQQQSNVN